MATLAILPPKLVREYSQHHGKNVKEAASQTFKDGSLVQPTANSAGWATTTAGAGAAAGNLAVAAAAGQNSASPPNDLPILLIDGQSEIEISAVGAAATTALLSENTAGYGLSIDGPTGNHCLNLADTTNVVFKITDCRPVAGNIGDTNVRIKATIIAAKRFT